MAGFRAGQTFLYPHEDGRDAHLWIMVTDPNPEEFFLIVNLTSLQGSKDRTVCLMPKEHPFIKKPTCVHYQLAEITTSEKVQRYLDCGSATMHHDTSPELLDLVFAGFLASGHTKHRIRDFVKAVKAERASCTPIRAN